MLWWGKCLFFRWRRKLILTAPLDDVTPLPTRSPLAFLTKTVAPARKWSGETAVLTNKSSEAVFAMASFSLLAALACSASETTNGGLERAKLADGMARQRPKIYLKTVVTVISFSGWLSGRCFTMLPSMIVHLICNASVSVHCNQWFFPNISLYL